MISKLVLHAARSAFPTASRAPAATNCTRILAERTEAACQRALGTKTSSSETNSVAKIEQLPRSIKQVVAEELGKAGENCLDEGAYKAAKDLFGQAARLDPQNHCHSHLATMAELAEQGLFPSM